MRCLVVLVLVAFSVEVAAGAADEWSRPLVVEPQAAKVRAEVPRAQVFEVPVSMFEEAQKRLEANAAVPLQPYDLESLSRKHFSCPKSTTAFLVRAVYTNGNTGAYTLTQLDTALWVNHQSLGVSTGAHRSALIACLRFKPLQVYVTSGGAM